MAFPCWDEPDLKANFTVSLIAPTNWTALSNMDVKSESPIVSTQTNATKTLVRFNTSPKMATYLVAFTVGEYNYLETNDFRVPIRIYAPPDWDIQGAKYPLQLAVQSLDFYEKKWKIKYPLPKVDLIAVNDFSAGAMENWGMLTFRSELLFYNASTVSSEDKFTIANDIAHELGHQWFGDLVTLDWWSEVWLNEGL